MEQDPNYTSEVVTSVGTILIGLVIRWIEKRKMKKLNDKAKKG